MATQYTTVINASDSGYRIGSGEMKKEHASYTGYVSCGFHDGDDYFAYTYYKFNATQFAAIPKNAKIISAVFNSPYTANGSDDGAARTMYAGSVLNGWSGGGGGKPGRGVRISSTDGLWSRYSAKSLNVKELVEGWLSGLYNFSYGMYITAAATDYYAYFIIHKGATITIVWQEGGSVVYVGQENGTTIAHNIYVWDAATSTFKMCYLYYVDGSGTFIQT